MFSLAGLSTALASSVIFQILAALGFDQRHLVTLLLPVTGDSN